MKIYILRKMMQQEQLQSVHSYLENWRDEASARYSSVRVSEGHLEQRILVLESTGCRPTL